MGSEKAYLWQSGVPARLGPAALLGYLAIACFGGGFGVWAATAPLAGAIIAPGVIAASGDNVLVQQKDGGIIEKIDVKEGDQVAQGQILFVMDDTEAVSTLNRIIRQYISKSMNAARLVAERDGLSEMHAPEDLAIFPQAFDADKEFKEQQRQFSASLARYLTEQKILRQRIGMTEASLTGLKAQQKAFQEQILIVSEEAERKRKLLEKALTSRSEYTELLRANASLVGQAGQIEAQIASATLQLAEASQQMERLTTSRVENAVNTLNDVRASVLDLREQMQAAQAVVERTVVKSPADGIVLRSRYNVPGAVIGAGETAMELMPTANPLIVDARVQPVDIDNVHVGDEAELQLTSLNPRTTPSVTGHVFYVSADRLVDPKTGLAYYSVRLKLEKPLPSPISSEDIYPGMPVQCFITGRERTFLAYVAQPLTDSFHRAFREE